MSADGRGRGRGRGSAWNKENVSDKSPWNRSNIPPKESSSKKENKMIDMQSRYGNMLENLESSSSEDEIHDEEIMTKLKKNFTEVLDDDDESHSNQMIQDVLQSGAVCCLVCIENIKHLNAIWNCTKCCCIFHLQCIQKWAKEGIGRQAIKAEGDISELEFSWNCPKCRQEYSKRECPTKYLCFCGKEENPPFDPWNVPHSCGSKCGKELQPKCGHECLLLCHPGPCPPCPKTVKSKCHCGKSNPVLKRCSKKYWSCSSVCNKQLPCGHHTCQETCHSGECPPCSNTSNRPCMCGKKVSIRKCAENNWSCEEMCGKALSCGHHLCEKECHTALCGDCPRSGKRSCPCGKTKMELPCTEDVNTCVDTCMKQLNCGLHDCSKKCHFGSCESCLQVVEKTCRCGRKTKEVPCSQSMTCDIKCTRTRICGRHPCKKKCCDGSCPPCEQVCNRTLNCRNHKCPSPCHEGLCYPCPATKQVSCFCGANTITTPCGKERSVKPPRCKNVCKIAPDCHHDKRETHRCHLGRCPSCKFVCNKDFACGHTCPDVCHEKVRDKQAENRNLLRGIHNKKGDNQVYVSLPCQPCRKPVKKLCLGEHGTEEFACTEVQPYSCTSPCSRELQCGNHVCMKKCHVVKGRPAEGKAGSNCNTCEELCRKPRLDGCIHDCKLPCHSGDCPKCAAHVKMSCHCKTLQIYLKCCEFNEVDKKTQEELLCCKVRCPKLIGCGHLCSKLCHKGTCSDSNECQDKKKVKCKCGRKKKDLPCQDVTEGQKLECDDKCFEIKNKKLKDKQNQEEEEAQAKLKLEQEELEKFERKKHGRKRKQRQDLTDEVVQDGFLQKYKFWMVAMVLVMVFAAFCVQLFIS